MVFRMILVSTMFVHPTFTTPPAGARTLLDKQDDYSETGNVHYRPGNSGGSRDCRDIISRIVPSQ